MKNFLPTIPIGVNTHTNYEKTKVDDKNIRIIKWWNVGEKQCTLYIPEWGLCARFNHVKKND